MSYWTAITAGPDFWRGSCFARQGEAAILNEDDAQLASHAVSAYADTVDELEEAGTGSAGTIIRRKFEEVSLPSTFTIKPYLYIWGHHQTLPCTAVAAADWAGLQRRRNLHGCLGLAGVAATQHRRLRLHG